MMLSRPLYKTNKGKAYVGDALTLLKELNSESVDLVITSPPFALQRKKSYGNEDQDKYVDWLLSFTPEIKRVLKETGSFVLDLGGAYQKGRPTRSIYQYHVLVRMCDEFGWNLAEEFFWFNPSKLPSPIEWVNKRKIRAKDSVNTVWWFSKSDYPKANVSNVLSPYSDRMKKLLTNKTRYYEPKLRPSGHDISEGFNHDNGGAIPSNLLQIPNSESNSQYLRYCKLVGAQGHPARFPAKLPEFFIKFLTDENDLVVDIFSGSNTTGAVAQVLNRKWLAFDLDKSYVAASAFRFLSNGSDEAASLYGNLMREGAHDIEIKSKSLSLFLDPENVS